MKGPLDGVVVADLTHAFSGPFCTYHLAMMGAEVLKIEPPGGDLFRKRPSTFAAINAGKRSIVIDLKTEAGKQKLAQIVARADVLVQNYRPGVAEKLGFDAAACAAINPQLIYCAISGYGQNGEWADRPAIEWSVQAASGLAKAYLSEDRDQLDPGLPVLDAFSGYMGYATIAAALYQRERTGKGTTIDTAMLDAALVIATPRVAAVAAGARPEMQRRPTVGRYRGSDGKRISIAAASPSAIQNFLDALGLSRELCADELEREIARAISDQPAAYWEAWLLARGIPAALVNDYREVIDSSHVRARGSIIDVVAEDGRTGRTVGPGVRLDGQIPEFDRRVAPLGESNHR